MLNEQMLQQYYELLGKDGVTDMRNTFADNIGGYVEQLMFSVKNQDVEELKKQAHRIKGACLSVGLQELSVLMEKIEKEPLSDWTRLQHEVEQWIAELPAHQQRLKHWVDAL